ncbi:MAG: hypothetical protein R6U27_14615, partial [Desulfobacterales bacterium]
MDIMKAWADAWMQLQEMVFGFFAALPQIGVAIVVFALLYFVANWIRSAVKRVAQTAELTPGAEMVLSRLARWLVIGLGFLLALTVAIPSFEPGQLIQLLGIGSV